MARIHSFPTQSILMTMWLLRVQGQRPRLLHLWKLQRHLPLLQRQRERPHCPLHCFPQAWHQRWNVKIATRSSFKSMVTLVTAYGCGGELLWTFKPPFVNGTNRSVKLVAPHAKHVTLSSPPVPLPWRLLSVGLPPLFLHLP